MKNTFTGFLGICALGASLLLTGCYYDKNEYLYGVQECPPTDVSYKSQVEPIISQSCAVTGCHGDDQGPLFTSLEAVQNNSTKIQTEVLNGTMPPIGTLPEEDIKLINCWINQGAKDN